MLNASPLKKPDFAFPKKASEEAEKNLTAALRKGNDVEALRSLLNIVLAQNAIDSDRMPQCLERIDSVGRLFTAPAPRAVTDLLAATIYADYYRSNMWSIDRRPDTGAPAPADYTEWNTAQFEARVAELLNSAMAAPDILLSTPLRTYDILLDIPARDSRIEYMFYPSLLDFVGSQAIELIQYFRTPSARSLADEYRATLIRLNASHPAPLIINRIAALQSSGADFYRGLTDLYESSRSSAFCGEALIALGAVTDYSDIDRARSLKALIDGFMEQYPTYIRIDAIKDILASITARHASIAASKVVTPGGYVTVEADAYNIAELKVTLYRLPDSFDFRNNYSYQTKDGIIPPALRKAGEVTLKMSGTAPFKATATDSIRVAEPGCYIAVPDAPGLRRDNSYNIIRCTSLAIGSVTAGTDQKILVVNPLTGQPVAGTTIEQVRRKVTSALGVTGADGLLPISVDDSRRADELYPVKGADRFADGFSAYFYGTRIDTTRQYHINAFTALPLYRPGDTVDFTAMVYSLKELDYRCEEGLTVKATLYDANHTEVDTLTLTTDRYGRVAGSFTIPDDGRLNGSYSINTSCPDPGVGSYHYFTISDYKLPTFAVEVTETATDRPEKGAVTLVGRAMTYSGVPLQGADIEITVKNVMMWWRPWSRDEGTFTPVTLSATTDDTGRWEITVPAADLAKAPAGSWFSADVTATSSAGESQATSTVFALGPAIRIDARLNRAYDVTTPLKLPVKITDTAGKSIDDITVGYEIIRNDKAVASGNFSSGNPVADWSAIAPGTYDIRFTIDGDTTLCNGIALYRPDINRSPSDEIVWTPADRVTLGIDGTADILLATSMDTTYVLYTLYDYNHVIEQRWLTLPAGLNHVEADVKRGGEHRLRASFMAAGRYSSRELTVSLATEINPRNLRLRAESMRDRSLPGSTETWRLSVVNATGTPVEAALMVDMYNDALTALASGRWNFGVASPSSISINFRGPLVGGTTHAGLRPYTSRSSSFPSYSIPSWQLYGMSFMPQIFRIRGSRLNSRAMMKADYDGLEMAEECESEMAVSDMKMSALAAPAPATAGGAVPTEESADEAVNEDGGAPQPEAAAPFAYRDAEVALGLFRPMLVTGPDGNLELTFTMPDANATWAFQAIAWTDDMRDARLGAKIIAAKPVMVKPNAPRFLREADRAVVLTSVINATDSIQEVDATVEIFNPATGDVISRTAERLTLAPSATAVVAVNAEAAPGLSMVGIRAKASTPLFADGEQSIIPVLPAATPVIDSEPFYMGPDTHEATVTMPASPDAEQAITSLEFCENPVWYVVTALPGLSASEPVTAPGAAGAIFSASVARGLIKRYPAIAEALRSWTAEGESSVALTAMLERNDDLKAMTLAATPWMMDARSDAERMQRLALLFDSRRIDNTISDAVALLSRLERDGGGWAWISSLMEPSEWATDEALSLFAALSGYGFMPSDKTLDAMITRAVGFIDAEAVKTARRYPEAILTSFALLRAAYPGVKASDEVERIMARATEKVVSDWKSYPLEDKPEAAMLLWRRGKKSVAADILASMREYMTSSPDRGTFFPSLQNSAAGYLSYTARALTAFATIDPGCPEIDGLRHWLVVQKQATDWGSSAYASEVVTAILASSGSWIADARGTAVKVNGHKLDVTPADRRLGYFRTALDVNASAPLTVTLSRPADTPSWGAVMRRSVMPLRAVEAAACPDLSIEKSIIGADSLAVGGKVTVRLVVKVARNLNYVTITDARAACFEPVEQLPSVRYSEGVAFYLEPRDSQTDIFITTMPKGTYVLSYDLYVNSAGTYASGIAVAQSQYAPEITARSAGQELTVSGK